MAAVKADMKLTVTFKYSSILYGYNGTTSNIYIQPLIESIPLIFIILILGLILIYKRYFVFPLLDLSG